MSKTRKGVAQIRFEIIEYLYYSLKPQLKTHIWRRATTLSYDDFQKHLYYLIEKGLVVEQENGNCLITKEGRAIYKKLRNALFSIL